MPRPRLTDYEHIREALESLAAFDDPTEYARLALEALDRLAEENNSLKQRVTDLTNVVNKRGGTIDQGWERIRDLQDERLYLLKENETLRRQLKEVQEYRDELLKR